MRIIVKGIKADGRNFLSVSVYEVYSYYTVETDSMDSSIQIITNTDGSNQAIAGVS